MYKLSLAAGTEIFGIDHITRAVCPILSQFNAVRCHATYRLPSKTT